MVNLKKITQAVLQAGFSRQVIGPKWPNFKVAFDVFEVNRVANITEEDIECSNEDKWIVRNGRKITTTVYNAWYAKH